jgi:hypothetical protein
LWIQEKESLYFAALKKDVGWLKKIQREKNWNACKWLEAEEIDKISHQTFAWWNLIRTRRQHRCFPISP